MMEFLRTLSARVAALFRRRQLDKDLEQELRSHLELSMELNRQKA